MPDLYPAIVEKALHGEAANHESLRDRTVGERRTMIYRVLSAYVGLYAYWILLLQVLSPFHQITFRPVLIGALLGVALVARLLLPHPRVWCVMMRAWRETVSLEGFVCPATLSFIIVVPPLVVLLFIQGWHFPPNDWDAMTYHLARAAYWRQFHSLGHYTSNSVFQIAYPGNVEVLYTVLLVLTHSAQNTFLVQIAAYFMSCLAIHGLGVQAGARPAYALFGAGLFATMPEVVLQSNGIDVDIAVASFVLCAVYFFVRSVQVPRRADVVLVALALGLAIGAKPTAMLALPGLGIAGVFLVIQPPHLQEGLRRWANWTKTRFRDQPQRIHVVPRAHILTYTLAAVLAFALAAPWYIENLIDFGALGGPAQLTNLQLVSQKSPVSFTVGLLRHLIAFLDPAGPAMIKNSTGAWFYGRLDDLRSWLAATTRARTVVPAIEWPGQGYVSTAFSDFNSATSWYGLIGGLTVYLALAHIARSILRLRNSVTTLCAAGATSYLLSTVLLLRWQPPEGHLLLPLVALCCPVAAVTAQHLATRRVGTWLLCAGALYAAAGAPTAAILNNQHPLAAWFERNAAQQAAWYTQLTPLLDAIEHLIPNNVSVAIMFPNSPRNHDWEFPVFGPDLSRTVIPIKLPISSGGTFPGTAEFSFSAPFTYLITHTSDTLIAQFFAARPQIRCVLLRRVNTYDGYSFTFFRCADITVQELYAGVLRARNMGDYSGALLQLDQILRINPNYKDTIFVKGWALWYTGQWAAAITLYRSYLKSHPGNVEAQLNLGYSLIKQERCAEALVILNKLLDQHPKNVTARHDLAICEAT